MSIDYSITLQDKHWITLKGNFWGIVDGITTQDSLTLSLFAFDKDWNPIFSTVFWYWEIIQIFTYFASISIIKDSSSYSSAKFIETNDIIELIRPFPFDRNILKILLTKLSLETKIHEIISTLSEEELSWITTNHLEIQRKRVLEVLKNRLVSSTWFSETSWDDSWQRWITKNSWLTWANYLEPIEKVKINISWVMPDYLFPTHDGFVDLLEIKLPDDEVIRKDSSHSGSWFWTSEVTKAIGQVINYIWEIDRWRIEIERQIKITYHKNITLVRPRVYILIWNDDNWFCDEPNDDVRKIKREEKLEALRKLNGSLHWIEVITYAELLRRWNSFLNEI